MRMFELFEEGKIVPGVNTTQDVKVGEIPRQARKFGNAVATTGIPPILKTNGKFDPPCKDK